MNENRKETQRDTEYVSSSEEGKVENFMDVVSFPDGDVFGKQKIMDSEHDPLEQLWHDIASIDGDGSAAQEMLKAGIPIYYKEKDTQPGLQIKKYPDGRRELVRFSRQGDEVISIL